ncbi:MAG: potassium channel family protein [Clostridiales bacterium]|nr:potassium channel family protein [Clostridiales bacterium]
MRRKRRLYIVFIAVLACIYVVLLLAMLLAESANPQSSIRTLEDAIWYSVATLTTVGYGDVTPITPIGHAVGIVFLLLSTGILLTLFGTFLSFLMSEGFPLLVLSMQKKKNWYYFADMGLEANTLAQQILAEDPRAVIIYGQGKSAVE